MFQYYNYIRECNERINTVINNNIKHLKTNNYEKSFKSIN